MEPARKRELCAVVSFEEGTWGRTGRASARFGLRVLGSTQQIGDSPSSFFQAPEISPRCLIQLSSAIETVGTCSNGLWEVPLGLFSIPVRLHFPLDFAPLPLGDSRLVGDLGVVLRSDSSPGFVEVEILEWYLRSAVPDASFGRWMPMGSQPLSNFSPREYGEDELVRVCVAM